MKIEFNAPYNEVPEHIFGYVKEKLLSLHRRDNEIADASVSFKKANAGTEAEFICEITVRMFGDTLLVHRRAGNYSGAAREVINEIELKADELKSMLKNLPEEILTTVKA